MASSHTAASSETKKSNLGWTTQFLIVSRLDCVDQGLVQCRLQKIQHGRPGVHCPVMYRANLGPMYDGAPPLPDVARTWDFDTIMEAVPDPARRDIFCPNF